MNYKTHVINISSNLSFNIHIKLIIINSIIIELYISILI